MRADRRDSRREVTTNHRRRAASNSHSQWHKDINQEWSLQTLEGHHTPHNPLIQQHMAVRLPAKPRQLRQQRQRQQLNKHRRCARDTPQIRSSTNPCARVVDR